MSEKFTSFLNSLKTIYSNIKERTNKGIEWIGVDGAANIGTSSIITIFLMLFFPCIWAMLFGVIIVAGKCALDKSRGSEHEGHDLICSVVGVLLGAFLGTAHAAIILM